MSDEVERRLTVIVSADVVGYARLIRADEAGTRAVLNSHRRETIDPALHAWHGRLVSTAGDSFLIEFPSVVEAVECAVAVQRDMVTRNAEVPEDRRIIFRIGINLGDVIIEGGDIHGDGVNVAARLQSLSEPGGICIAANVFEQVRHRLSLGFEDLGEQQVKNIADPVRAYRVLLAPEAAGTLIKRPPVRQRSIILRWRWAVPTAAVVAAIVAVLVWWQLPRGPTAVQGEPVIAVLPFDSLSGDPADRRLANGITEDIITDLSRDSRFAVIARNSTAVYQDKPTDVRRIGKDLNVSHVLEGSLQREGGQVRITAQLIETATGTHIWSERYDRPAGEVFAIQSEVVDRIANSLGGPTGSVAGSLVTTAKRKQPSDLSAYELYLLGDEKMLKGLDLDSQKEATKLLERAIQLDPNLVRARQALAWTYSFRALLEPDFSGLMQKMLAEARLAVELDPADADAQMALG